jgi:hypothetical protein
MGSRRLGARRLNAALKRGSSDTDLTYQSGAGIASAVVSHKVIKTGGLIQTHILLDLGKTNSAGQSLWGGGDDRDVIGYSDDRDATNAVSDASIMTFEDSVHGMFRSIEVQCVELIAGGANVISDVGFVMANPAAALSQDSASNVADDETLLTSNNGWDLINPDASWTLGGHKAYGSQQALSNSDPDAAQLDLNANFDGMKLFLVQGAADAGAATNYTAGKFLIIIEGADLSW